MIGGALENNIALLNDLEELPEVIRAYTQLKERIDREIDKRWNDMR